MTDKLDGNGDWLIPTAVKMVEDTLTNDLPPEEGGTGPSPEKARVVELAKAGNAPVATTASGSFDGDDRHFLADYCLASDDKRLAIRAIWKVLK